MEPIETLGGRRPLPQLLAAGVLPYRDKKQAKLLLDRHKVPFVVINRQRWYRPAAIAEALDRAERQQTEAAAA